MNLARALLVAAFAIFSLSAPVQADDGNYVLTTKCTTPSMVRAYPVLFHFGRAAGVKSVELRDYLVVTDNGQIRTFGSQEVQTGLSVAVTPTIQGNEVTLAGAFKCNELLRLEGGVNETQHPVVGGFSREKTTIKLPMGGTTVIEEDGARLELTVSPLPRL